MVTFLHNMSGIMQSLLSGYGSSTLLNGLISYHKLDGNSTASVGGNGTDNVITYVSGIIGQGASFNGTNSNIAIPDSASYKVTTAFTISLWMKSSDTTGTGGLFSYLNTDTGTGNPYGGYYLRYITNKLGFIVTRYNTPSGAIDVQTNGTTNICDGTFKHLILNYDGTNIKSYINNTLETTVAYTSTITYCTNNYPRFGVLTTDRAGNLNYANAVIDEVGVWSRSLTSGEMSQLYNGGSGRTHPF